MGQKFNKIYNQSGTNYRSYEEAENRLSRIKRDNMEFVANCVIAGHMIPHKQWKIMGDAICGFYIIETVEI